MRKCAVCEKEMYAFDEYYAKKENGVWVRWHLNCKREVKG